jgi:acyl dehydratase/NAD(P)-dependent dehydrogenase (short-subunit alcohol dehydrogenase family)
MRSQSGLRFRVSASGIAAFARLSGDVNPLHVDPAYAERTQFGGVIAHGMLVVLTALDRLAASGAEGFSRVQATFPAPVHPNDDLEVVLRESDGKRRAEVVTNGIVCVRLRLSGHATIKNPAPLAPARARSQVPRSDEVASLDTIRGSLNVAGDERELERLFPHLVAQLGSRPVMALALVSSVVGMECPGLRSLFAELDVSLDTDTADLQESLEFEVTNADVEKRYVSLRLRGGGITATVGAFVRPESPKQPSMALVNSRVLRGEFADERALVIGGSRGIGEVAAKTLAAGGANVCVTYRTARAEAERVAAEIESAGGRCVIAPYDVETGESSEFLAKDFTLIVYMASPRIFRRRTSGFDRTAFDEFCAAYVAGFASTVSKFREAAKAPIAVLYPSTVMLDEDPSMAAEYAAAKAAGEALCRALSAADKGLIIAIERLPRILTDQTNSVVSAPSADPVDVLLPAFRALRDKRKNAE